MAVESKYAVGENRLKQRTIITIYIYGVLLFLFEINVKNLSVFYKILSGDKIFVFYGNS